VIHVWHVDEPGHVDSTRNVPLFRSIVDADALVRGTWGVRPVEGLEPADGEAVVEKQRMSAFNSTTLDTKLRGLGVRRVVVCGAWTNFAIEHTCRDGADHGYEVVLAAAAAEAERVCAERGAEIALVLTDVVMPDGTGQALAERLADAAPDTRVLFMSGYSDEAVYHHGVIRPDAAFIEKPFSAQTLARKVRATLDSPRGEHEPAANPDAWPTLPTPP
jgi:CheY-like chemotaxis protein